MSAQRPYFHGISQEQIEPLIDGIPAREPVTGLWISPPSRAVDAVELLSGGMVPEAGQSLGEALSIHLAEGSDTRRARISCESDRLGVGMASPWSTDLFQAGASGPVGGEDLYYSVAWQGMATDTYVRYPRDLPTQTVLGLIDVPSRMEGSEAGSFKLTWHPQDAHWQASAAGISSRARNKEYLDPYSREGWVGYLRQYNTYTTFLNGPDRPDSSIYYVGPAAVPVTTRSSTLIYLNVTRTFTAPSYLRLYLGLGRHTQRAGPVSVSFVNEDSLRRWAVRETTNRRHQEEPYYAVHGYDPEYRWGISNEILLGGSGCFRPAAAHDVRFGTGLIAGRHRYVQLIPDAYGYSCGAGSFHRTTQVADGYAYLEDIWYSDRLSWVQASLREVFREAAFGGHVYHKERLAPALAFHQPMTPSDAFHFEAGRSYQFSSLLPVLLSNTTDVTGVNLEAQNVWFIELGAQHHFSPAAVLYLGAYQRSYGNLVFTSTTGPGAFLFACQYPAAPSLDLESHGIELILDHRLGSAWSGQFSVAVSNSAGDTSEVSWSRRVFLRNQLCWAPRRTIAATLYTSWNPGRPYTLCDQVHCSKDDLISGRLPAELEVDLALRWRRPVWGADIELLAEVHNLLDRRIPTFDFAGGDGFLAYYHNTGRTDGYTAGGVSSLIDNPQTRTAGRSVLLGAQLGF